ncbi:hypothetical protein O23A_P3p0006 (plasmid) [Aeromonas salmonicida]|nr:hypothetical protein O23A_P3p0006 [Aeromonas salmonicida]
MSGVGGGMLEAYVDLSSPLDLSVTESDDDDLSDDDIYKMAVAWASFFDALIEDEGEI